ncbi:MAG: hypothetical protein R3B47_16545 [Bacteroidia bacterium]
MKKVNGPFIPYCSILSIGKEFGVSGAIMFARAEGTIPEAHDQEIMGKHSNADELSIEQLVKELRIVRQSTIMMFESFNRKILETTCRFFEYEMPLFAIGLTITAHQIHHFNIIEERYFPLDQ